MTRNLVTIRTYPGGLAASTVPYEVRTHAAGNALLPGGSGSTDANGQFTYQANLSPGPFYWKATDAGPTPPVVRQGSSKSCDSGGSFSIAEMPVALQAMGQGGVVRNFLNALAPSAGGGINFNVATGAAVLLGLPAVVYTAIANQACLAGRDATNPKACYLILQARGAGDPLEGEIVVYDWCGAAAASPALPALTQTQALWMEPLATFRLPATGGGSVLTNFVDVRRFLLSKNPQVSVVARRLSQTAINVTSPTGVDATWDDGSTALTLVSGVTYDVVNTVSLALKAAAGQTISLAPYINGTANAAPFISTTTSADFVVVTGVHTLAVVGTGAPMTCAALVKVTGGTGQHLTGTQLVTATPRR